MFFLHDVHQVTEASAPTLEALLRDRWAPALEREPGARLVWCARSTPASPSFPELITLTAVADGTRLERLGERLRDGDLATEVRALDEHRTGVTNRILAPLKFSRYEPDLTADGLLPDGGAVSFVHDFVTPRMGKQREYEEAMASIFMMLIELENIPIAIWAGFETVAGGGSVPESVMISRVGDYEALTNLVARDHPREGFKPGSWLYDALELRDTWTSRVVRTTPWSPTT